MIKEKLERIYWMLGGEENIGTTEELAEKARRIIGGMLNE